MAAVVADLVAVRVVLVGEWAGPHGACFAEDSDPELAGWPFHDMLFHWRSRMGTRPDAGPALPVPPVVKPVPAGPRFPLPRPDPARSPEAAPGTDRPPGTGPVTVQQLGELLHRSARVRSGRRVPAAEGGYEVSDRPYPSGFGLYELELYVVTDRCRDLPPGIFHYDPLGHALTLVNAAPQPLATLLDEARVATGGAARPPVLLAITSRIGRLSPRYAGLAYATTLRHVGLLQGTLGVVAGAVGLGCLPTALGDGDASGTALGLDRPAEVPVGEVVLWSRAEC